MKRTNPFESFEVLTKKNPDIDNKNINNEAKHNPTEVPKPNISTFFNKTEKEKKIIKTIYISEKLSQKLEDIAKKYNISVNEVITTILDKSLE